MSMINIIYTADQFQLRIVYRMLKGIGQLHIILIRLCVLSIIKYCKFWNRDANLRTSIDVAILKQSFQYIRKIDQTADRHIRADAGLVFIYT